jgi:predicted DCC family thiol-disulfide oxidoreductase YuxK
METSAQPVLLYDGECGLCNAVVRFMLKRDRRGVLRFAPLQGKTGQALLRRHGLNTQDFDSLVLVEDLASGEGGCFLRSAGALRALAELGGGWRWFARVLAVIPAGLRDGIYRLVARLRYRLFGRYRPTASPPNPEWVGRILD